ncbi:DNA annealing helicase and endonuclease ZRANB3-like isoform X4 [Leptotrombidium deliense]|uniref:DNA annealing helicase and endonuclease ZRANB3-like isoform X4 n=1 Tax=Leptotrombidium deliense TaxID=299467 RepID=A0A443SD69_9ACAR|nr:DNA annealing helicase and endonuclease ZRANB3-like isoform X4 [Leptotrombidium deliense]
MSGQPSSRRLQVKVRLKRNGYEFEVELSERHEELMRTLRSIDPSMDSISRTLDNTLSFNLKKFEVFNKTIDSLRGRYVFTLKKVWPTAVVPMQHFFTENQIFSEFEENVEIVKNYLDIDETLVERGKIEPHHIKGILFCKTREGNCILADEVGVGKRLQALIVSKLFVGSWPLLIVCPNVKTHLWLQDFEHLFPEYSHLTTLIVNSETNCEEISSDIAIVIIGFNQLEEYECVLQENNYEMVIIDEICMIATNSSRFKCLESVVKESKRTLLLTSSPLYRETFELLPYFQLILPSVFNQDFIRKAILRYTIADINDSNLVQHKAEYKRLLHSTLMLRRIRSEVMSKDKKLRRFIPLVLTVNSAEVKELDIIYAKLENCISTNSDDLKEIVLSWFEICSKLKSTLIQEYLEIFVDIKYHKVVCYVVIDKIGDEIVSFMRKKNTRCIQIKKSTSTEDRIKVCEEFQKDTFEGFAVMNLDIANTRGVKLSSADTVIFCELHSDVYLMLAAENMIACDKQVEGIPVFDYLALCEQTDCRAIDSILCPLLNSVFKKEIPHLITELQDSMQTKMIKAMRESKFLNDLVRFGKGTNTEAEQSNKLKNGKEFTRQNSSVIKEKHKQVQKINNSKSDVEKRKLHEHKKRDDAVCSDESDSESYSEAERIIKYTHKKVCEDEDELWKDECYDPEFKGTESTSDAKSSSDSVDELWGDEKTDPDYGSKNKTGHKRKRRIIAVNKDTTSGSESDSSSSELSAGADNVDGCRRSRRIKKHDGEQKNGSKFEELRKKRKKLNGNDKQKSNECDSSDSESNESDNSKSSSSSSSSSPAESPKKMNKRGLKILAKSFVR